MWITSIFSLVLAGAMVGRAEGGSLKDIKHVVLFMQENRSFNHVSALFALRIARVWF